MKKFADIRKPDHEQPLSEMAIPKPPSRSRNRFFRWAGVLVVTLLFGGATIAMASLSFSGTTLTSSSTLTIDSASTIAIGASSSTGITIGNLGATTTFPGNVAMQNLMISGTCTGCGTGGGSSSSDETVDASAYSGANWMAKVNAAATALGGAGGTIVIPDSIAGDGSATTGTIPSNVTLDFSGSATFTFCNIDIGTYTKIYNDGDALLQMKSGGSNCGGISSLAASGATMQTNDKLVLSGIRVDCNFQPGSSGVQLGGGSAEVDMEGSWSISNCETVGLYLGAIQFGEFSGGHLWQNYVGLKIYASSGGGSSNDFYGTQIVNSTACDAIINNQSNGADDLYADYFYNANIQSAGDCGMAVIGSSVHWIGGAPEHQDQSGTATSTTIDGTTIQPASVYLNDSYFSFSDGDIQDFQISPEIDATNYSNVVLQNTGGYGTTRQFVSADATSKVQMVGAYGGQGIINNVTEWPGAIFPPGFGVIKLIGSPLLDYNPDVPNFYTGNPLAPSLQSCDSGASCGTATDPFYGTVATVAHTSSIGSQDVNRFLISNPFGTSLSGNQDYVVSFLIKSNVNSNYEVGYYGDNNTIAGGTVTNLNLIAGQWQRFVMVVGNKASNYAGTGLVGFPNDTSAPTISITGFEALAYPTGSLQGQEYTSFILESGSVNPNGDSSITASGIGVGTAAPSTTLQVAGVTPTIRIGAGTTPGCLELMDSSGNGAVNYITITGGILTTTTTKPTACQ